MFVVYLMYSIVTMFVVYLMYSIVTMFVVYLMYSIAEWRRDCLTLTNQSMRRQEEGLSSG